ncbi:xanthine dehydrogenase family protein subunit M [Nitratireductor sp. CAU 1489]|uniref:Xanthine dehydrogenase family protein subunit M n=1 Tax=Nitratireductor arenosus TaxID=2682096 RepID=A0A844QHJ5_9HYPH|nr:xanthine dehydrogenase family protein subunit M [Nitratireductor arenosus]MVA99396.1 xanthine dehydrogenase family protein subunit M [Nitratireductor arenosus]
MRRFDYYQPESLEEASALMADLGSEASVIAGGTDLLVEIKEELRKPLHVVDIKKIPGLKDYRYDAEAGLRFGALVAARELEIWAPVIEHYPNLRTAVSALGSIQVRNRATVVGNVCRASPSADTIPPLVADGASLSVYNRGQERHILVEDLFTGPGRTVLVPGDIVTGISVPPSRPQSGRAYIKHGRRKAMELATVGVAVSLERDGNTCTEIRIALGAVAPTPIRARNAEALLRGRAIDPAAIAAIADAAMAESTPISNVRASAAYRREMVGVLTRRAIGQAMGGI